MVKILIVDDYEGIRQLISYALEDLDGVQIIQADNVLMAKEVILQDGPDLIFSDVNMPGESGVDLFQWVSLYFPFTKFGFVTSRDPIDLLDELAGLEPDFIIEKPFETFEILSAAMRGM